MRTSTRCLILSMAVTMVILAVPFMLPSEESDGASTVGTVTFDPNFPSDATGKTGSAKSVSFIPDNGIELPTKIFSCTNYILTGWGTSKSGGVTYSWDKDYTVKAGTTTLYAQWTSIRTDGGQNVYDSNAPSSSTIQSSYTYQPVTNGQANNDEWTLYYAIVEGGYNAYVKSCPDWLNISLEKRTVTCKGSPTAPGNYYVEIQIQNAYSSESKWHYIIWTINVPSETDETYTISYDLNGGSGSTPASTTGTYAQGVTLSRAFVGSTEITKDGYTLGGWDIEDQFGTVSTYPLGAQYGLYKNVTAKAHWVSNPNVIVFSMDGGSLKNVEAYVTDTGEYYSLPSSSNALKDGCTLIGWHVTGDSQAVYAPGYLMKISGSVKLEAHYATAAELSSLKTVTYNYCGGSGPVASQQIESGGFVYLPEAGCERSGYSFVGWSLTDGGEVINTLSYEIASDITLFAVWKETSGGDTPGEDPERWTVIFDPNGGNTSVPSQTVTDKGFAYQPNGVIKEGHILTGWYSKLLNKTWDFGSDQVTQNMVLTAQWSTHFTYTVSGLHVIVSISDDWSELATVNWGDGTTTETYSGTAEHDYIGSNYSSRIVVSSVVGGIVYTSSLPLSGLDESHVPTARTCEITFDTAGGSPDTWTVTVNRLDTVKKPDDPAKEGYTFLGWYLAGIEYDFTQPVESNLYLIAKWRDDSSGTIDPDPVVIKPVAIITMEKTDTGYKFGAGNSANAVLWKWYLSGTNYNKRSIGTEETVTFIGTLEPGTYTVSLTVYSSTGHTDTAVKEFAVDPEKEDGGSGGGRGSDWFSEHKTLILILIIVGIAAAFILMRFVI